MNKRKIKLRFTYNMALFLICVAVFMTFTMINPNFTNTRHLVETTRLIVEIGIMAMPLTLLIVMGSIDFSMASVLVLSVAVGGIATPVIGAPLGLLLTFAVGILCGSFNGFLVAKLRLPPLVTTLATMYLFRGIALVITLANPAVGANVPATGIALFFGASYTWGIPHQAFVFVILAVIFHLALSRTTYGRMLFAIGLNEDAASFSGINTTKIKLLTFIVAGFVFSIAGLVLMGRFSTIQFNSADPFTMQVITASVLGGSDMRGGRGNIIGTIWGVSIIGILRAGMNLILLPQTQQRVILGIVLMLSLLVFDQISSRALRVKKPTEKAKEASA